MALSNYELSAIETRIKEKMLVRFFSFSKLEVKQTGTKLSFRFVDVSHSVLKNIVIMSHDSDVKETSLLTYVNVRLRFLYNGRNSPVIGHNLINFKMTFQ